MLSIKVGEEMEGQVFFPSRCWSKVLPLECGAMAFLDQILGWLNLFCIPFD